MAMYPRTSSTRVKEGKEVVSVVEIWIGLDDLRFCTDDAARVAFAKQITYVMRFLVLLLLQP